MAKKKSPMTMEEKCKLREFRIRGKEGRLSPEEIRFCSEMMEKYGVDQYESVISDKEVLGETALGQLMKTVPSLKRK